MPVWCAAEGSRQLRPLPLCLDAQVAAGLFERDLDLPAETNQVTICSGVAPRSVQSSASGLELALRVPDQDPAGGHDRQTTVVPDRRPAGQFHLTRAATIPAHRARLPHGGRILTRAASVG